MSKDGFARAAPLFSGKRAHPRIAVLTFHLHVMVSTCVMVSLSNHRDEWSGAEPVEAHRRHGELYVMVSLSNHRDEWSGAEPVEAHWRQGRPMSW
jgi:hypothetical protein